MKRIASLICALAFASAIFGEEPKAMDATDLEKLRDQAGQDVVVEGLVSAIGTTKANTITFINLGTQKKQGFVAVIFQKNYGAFPEGFGTFKGKNVRVSGKLELYNGERPEIELRSPEQIQVLQAK
jgi:DNA/RNA endonuclease YhcR with UshA esterase domain